MTYAFIFAIGVLLGAVAGMVVSNTINRRIIKKLRDKVYMLKNGIPEPKTNTSNLILIIVAVFLLAFILTMIVIFCIYGAVPDTLIQCTMGAGGVEALLLAAIKISKVVKGSKAEPEEPADTSNDEACG